MAVQTTKTNKPFNPRGNDQSPKGYNRASLFSGKALDFDGVNDYVDAGTLDITGYTAISFAGYIKIDDFNSTQLVLSILHSNTDDIRIVVQTGYLEIGVDDGTYYRLLVDVNLNEWYFVNLTFDGSLLKAYINGQEAGSMTASFDFSTASGVINLGQRVGGGFPYDGQIAGTKIFNTALTAAQVADLYNNPEKVVPTGVDNTALKLWLPMQEGAGTTAYDGSGNGNHGTISGATYVHGIGAPVAQTAVIDWNKGTNIVPYSEYFSTYIQYGSPTITENNIISPQGLLNGTKVQRGSVDVPIRVGNITTLGSEYTMSIWAKAGTATKIKIDIGDESAPDYNLTNEWQRFNLTATPAGFTHIDIEMPSSSSGDYFYIFGLQLELSASVGPYIPTFGTAQTSPVLLPQGLTTGRDITGVNLFENVRKQGALNLDGNSWAEVHDNESLDFGTGSFTLEAWAKAAYLNQGSGLNVILSLGGSSSGGNTMSLNIDSGLLPIIYYNGFYSVDSSAQTAGDWMHIVGTYDETNRTIYVNGVQVDQDAQIAVSITNALVKQIGRDTNATRYYQDQIAQPRIYNRALTAEEVARNYNNAKSIYTNS